MIQCNQLGIPSRNGLVYVSTPIPEGMTSPVWNGAEWRSDASIYQISTDPTPQSVTPRQFRQQLDIADLYDTVQAAVSAADTQTKIWWEYATSIERDNGPLNAMATALGVMQEQLDAIFVEANKL